MLAFKIEIEGQPPIIAGAEDWAVLSMHITAVRATAAGSETDGLSYSAGGLSGADESNVSHHFRWPRGALQLGSRVTITVIETDAPDVPLKRYRADGEVQESPYTKEEQMAVHRQAGCQTIETELDFRATQSLH